MDGDYFVYYIGKFIIPDTPCHQEYAVLPEGIVKDIRRPGKGHKIPKNLSVEKVAFLDNQEFLIYNSSEVLQPAEASLRLNVPIFVIAHDVYSAAGSLTSIAAMTAKITSVGTRNSRVLGRGTTPLLVSLPNSKIIISTEPILDLSGCKTAEDALHTKMEIEVKMTAKERIDYLNLDIEGMPLEEALTSYDPYFKAVLKNTKK